MKIVCALKDHPFSNSEESLGVVLYDGSTSENLGSAGGAIKYQVLKDKWAPPARAWDFLSLGLAVAAADLAGHRSESADGWTRQFELEIAVSDPTFWNSQSDLVSQMLGFLTTDQWRVRFLDGGFHPAPGKETVRPEEDGVVLLSGGLDSLVGAIDLAALGKAPTGCQPHRARRCGKPKAFCREYWRWVTSLSSESQCSSARP